MKTDNTRAMPVRLNKYVSEAGYCSRREADRLIAEGRITVDGTRAVPGLKVLPHQCILIDQIPLKKETEEILIVFHKPAGIVCTTSKEEPDNIVDYLNFPKRIYPVGRLDKESEGLILLTNRGEIADKILRGSNCHEKEYVVTVDKRLTPEFLLSMSRGVPVLDTVTRPCRLRPLDQKTFSIILTQGLNRQIRRMCEYFGYRVVLLRRIRIMNITLGNLKKGTWRNVTKKEKKILYQKIGIS